MAQNRNKGKSADLTSKSLRMFLGSHDGGSLNDGHILGLYAA
jgi:hypothetical protein